ncbi:MAG: hypothetical protein HOQ11_07560 [Gemmatimonadaceae bacterium]|nr:hypothetical protein [Gemmatimonadaceae bacterium]NUQ94062.1 hypothetical protein [Gemmatimonadaceae bacterium]NUS97248.1 hypothetical protein [Gemmatimonadaceae bacterium]
MTRSASAPRAVQAIAFFLLAACGSSPAATLGRTTAEARTNSDDFFRALALRLGPLTRTERLKVVRPRYVRGSLVPSRIFDDTVIWTARNGPVRTLVVAGAPLADGRYLLDVRGDAAPPARVGESRHAMHLREIGGGVYEWSSSDELAVGAATPPQIDAMRQRFLAAGEGRSGAELRALWRRGLPRTTAALGRLFDMDSIATTILPDRSTALAFRVSMHTDRLATTYPDFAKYLAKYTSPARYRVVLEDYQGVPFATIVAGDDVLHVRVRTRDGVLQPLAGPARATSPDSLRMRMDFSSKVSLFTVGANGLVADVAPVRGATERGWSVHWRREPDWHFPLAVDHLMGAALRRPFTGEGIAMRIVARAGAGGQTLVARDFRMDVQEAAIVRWISALGNSAMSDVTVRVEQQKDRFMADAISALGADLAAQLGESTLTGESGR